MTKKVQDIIHKEFEKEISDKERELLEVDQVRATLREVFNTKIL